MKLPLLLLVLCLLLPVSALADGETTEGLLPTPSPFDEMLELTVPQGRCQFILHKEWSTPVTNYASRINGAVIYRDSRDESHPIVTSTIQCEMKRDYGLYMLYKCQSTSYDKFVSVVWNVGDPGDGFCTDFLKYLKAHDTF